MTPSLTDLVKLWCEEVLPPKAFERVRWQKIDFNKDWVIFYLGSRAVAYIYDDFIMLLDARSMAIDEPRLMAADPEFFDRLGKHLLSRIKQ